MERVSECKSDPPNALDVQKTAANVFSEELSYHQAHWTVVNDNVASAALERLSYQKIIPYLDGLHKLNANSHISYETSKEENIKRIFYHLNLWTNYWKM